jgi:hypothetical protein
MISPTDPSEAFPARGRTFRIRFISAIFLCLRYRDDKGRPKKLQICRIVPGILSRRRARIRLVHIPVLNHEDAIGCLCQTFIMRNHEERDSGLTVISRIILKTSPLERLSRFPVGSSARTIFGWFARERTIAQR